MGLSDEFPSRLGGLRVPTRHDIAIIGSGGGAFAAAIRATTLGTSVVMIERGTFGGTCVR